ncbi:uncharacterized protein OCT59_018331 [Rhizophagus irregularis]|uniref:uncharacterized protein n=1 Tax=Rhizophagus irregularis TaxID=588596 RepID=UPI003332C6CA|nr:hypothetical protein OCT59_018331 [Rhizophagus irregularis]
MFQFLTFLFFTKHFLTFHLIFSIGTKSAPTWMPNSKGNQLLLGYRIPKEISSNVDADIPDEFRNIFETSLKKTKSAPNWIPESRKEISSKLYRNPAEIGSDLDTNPQKSAPKLGYRIPGKSAKSPRSGFRRAGKPIDKFRSSIPKVQNTKEIGSELANSIGNRL